MPYLNPSPFVSYAEYTVFSNPYYNTQLWPIKRKNRNLDYATIKSIYFNTVNTFNFKCCIIGFELLFLVFVLQSKVHAQGATSQISLNWHIGLR